MKRLIASVLIAFGAVSLHAAIAELNPAEGSIQTADGSFSGRNFTIIKDFKLELMYVPSAATEGRWVPMEFDKQGRLIVAGYDADFLMRLTLPKVGSSDPVKIERIMNNVGAAEGLLALTPDTLYMNVNRSNIRRHGIYVLKDTNGDDKYDQIRVLRNLQGSGDHGTHALRLSPDKTRIFVENGNATPMTKLDRSRVPPNWSEDFLVTRNFQGGPGPGFAPEAWIASFKPDGTDWELWSVGNRNPVDMNYNKDGELFLYDSDMEFDMGLPWYRATNVQHIISGQDSGWRDGSRKHPPWHFDYHAPIALVGSGSPVGVVFGTGGKMPARFQDGMFIADYSYGNVWQVNITPQGSSYAAEVLPFVSGSPFAVSGLVMNPNDGSLLINTTGTQLYRVSYTGDASTEATKPDTRLKGPRDIRHELENFHGKKNPAAIQAAWPYLGDADESIRHAARIALEWQDIGLWQQRALDEKDPRKAMAAILALARSSGQDVFHRAQIPLTEGQDPSTARFVTPPDMALRNRMLTALDRIDWDGLSYQEKLDLMRTYQVTFTRFPNARGAVMPDEATRQRLIAKFDNRFPAAGGRELNWELAELMIFLEAPSAASKTMSLLRSAPGYQYYPNKEFINPQGRVRNNPMLLGPAGMSEAFLAKQEDEIHYAELLRGLKTGWTPALRREFLTWANYAANNYQGGNLFAGGLQIIRADFLSGVPENERAQYSALIDAPLSYKGTTNQRGADVGTAPSTGPAVNAARGGGLPAPAAAAPRGGN